MPKTYEIISLQNDLIEKITKDAYSPQAVLDYLMTDKGYKQSYAYELRKDAYDAIREMLKDNLIDLYSFQMIRLEHRLVKADKKGDEHLALKILQEMNKIGGLYKERVEHTGNIVIKTKWGGEEDAKDDFFNID
ncbi:MAG: hypothetical protein BGO69_15820 [Bacteroidetes bacterium 46-16]|nr:MAG: hypothetical protein BGO69_15820 [Bacteroidetes bacterium 46-16]